MHIVREAATDGRPVASTASLDADLVTVTHIAEAVARRVASRGPLPSTPTCARRWLRSRLSRLA